LANGSIPGNARLVTFVPTTDPAKARVFYESVLGLRLVSDQLPFALVFDANGTLLRVTTVPEHNPQSFTILGWEVDAIEDTVKRLSAAGVEFLRYPGLNDSSPLPVWTSPSGARIAWFHDQDNNVLSLTQL
jgi:catechol 2,3-dioxygenase-like lactoylglutathione lyase family enzyme